MAAHINGKLKNYLIANLPATVPTNQRVTSMLAQWLNTQTAADSQGRVCATNTLQNLIRSAAGS